MEICQFVSGARVIAHSAARITVALNAYRKTELVTGIPRRFAFAIRGTSNRKPTAPVCSAPKTVLNVWI